MPSSPAELAAEILQGLTARYDQAYEALVRDDLERVATLLQETADLMQRLPASSAGDPRAAELHRHASESQGRLLAAIHGSMDAVQQELARIRHGQRALQGYGDHGGPGVGGHIESLT